MSVERTLSIIKPDAVAKNVIGQIVARFEQAGLKVVAAQLRQLSRADAERFRRADGGHQHRHAKRLQSVSRRRSRSVDGGRGSGGDVLRAGPTAGDGDGDVAADAEPAAAEAEVAAFPA